MPQVACAADGAPIHALFAALRPVLALPKATALPIALITALAGPGSTALTNNSAIPGGGFPVFATGALFANRAARHSAPAMVATRPVDDMATLTQNPVTLLDGPTLVMAPGPVGAAPQPAGTSGGGTVFDQAVFDNSGAPFSAVVPEPPTWSILGPGLVVLIALRVWVRHGPNRARVIAIGRAIDQRRRRQGLPAGRAGLAG